MEELNKMIKSTVIELTRGVFYWCVFLIIIGEGLGIFYSFYIGRMIDFIRNPELHYAEGIMHVTLFFSANFFCMLLKNHWI